MAYLRDVGLVAVPEPVVVGDPVEMLIGEFVGYLARERGLAPDSTSVYEYKRVGRLFLAGRLDRDGGGLDGLMAHDVTTFVLAQCRRRSYRMSLALVTSLRGLLRFLFLEGLTPIDLRGAVPGVAKWRAASLPRALPTGHVMRILAACDRTTAVGRRDFAILTALSRLGLRAFEVARLQLSDIDWRAGELIVRGKDDRHERAVESHERLLDRAQLAVFGETLDRCDRCAGGGDRESQAGNDAPAVVQDGAGATLPVVTALFRSREAELVPQRIEQRRTVIDGQRAGHAVDVQRNCTMGVAAHHLPLWGRVIGCRRAAWSWGSSFTEWMVGVSAVPRSEGGLAADRDVVRVGRLLR